LNLRGTSIRERAGAGAEGIKVSIHQKTKGSIRCGGRKLAGLLLKTRSISDSTQEIRVDRGRRGSGESIKKEGTVNT